MTYISNSNPAIIQFENVNEGRSYPFDDNATLVSIQGQELPNEVISDLHLVVPKGHDAYLGSVYLSENMLSVCIKMFSTTTFVSALSVMVLKDAFEPYKPYRLEKLTGSEDVGGIITFGNITFSDFCGTYRFMDRAIRVIDSAVSRYEPAGLRKIIDDRTGDYVTGDVALQFSSHITAAKNDEGITLSLDDSSRTVLASSCESQNPVNACGATPITSINGVKPDSQNRIVIWFH